MGDFSHPGVCSTNNTARHKPSRKFLERIYDNFLTQVIEKPMRRGALLDVILIHREVPTGDARLKAPLAALTMRWWSLGF